MNAPFDPKPLTRAERYPRLEAFLTETSWDSNQLWDELERFILDVLLEAINAQVAPRTMLQQWREDVERGRSR